MIETVLIGVGAAGNKAAINAFEKKALAEGNIKLFNTTLKDIPEKYKNSEMVVQFNSGLGGCGKEPSKGKKAIYEAIKDGSIKLDGILDAFTKQVVIVTSTEGGTGCGATPVIAKCYEAMNVPVHVFCFIGFQDEARGINNTLKFFKELSDCNVILHTICNDRFKDYTGSYTKAEEAANDEFVKQLKILLGSDLTPSSQNIDDTDHYKICTTPGYMDIKHIDLSGCKNVESTNEAVAKAFDNGSNLDYEEGCKRLAIIINASQKVQDAIDEQFEVIKRYVGEPFEIYRHIQSSGSGDYMNVIASGLAYPEQDIVNMNAEYNVLKDILSRKSKSFTDIFESIDVDDEDEFDMDVRSIRNVSGSSIDSILGIGESKPKSKKTAPINNVVVEDSIDNY